jgi:chromosome segregation ATPase
MREWEVLALEERTIRKDLGDKVGDLEEQLSGLKEAYEKAASERDSQSNTVDGLQKALQEIQIARKKELRELVESSQTEADKLRSQLAEAQNASISAVKELEIVKKELERALPFEKEVKEKNLLIGKLRHEAVTLNEHLTKALRFLKKGKPEDNVDRYVDIYSCSVLFPSLTLYLPPQHRRLLTPSFPGLPDKS